MPAISQSDADIALRPFFPDLVSVVQGAWQDWMTGNYAHQMQHKRVRANCVWNQWIANAKRRFDGHAEVRVETLKNWDGVLVKDRIFVRMKKGDHELLSRNYPTQAALDFHDSHRDLFGGIARLELLYVLNKAETAIERIALVQRHKSAVSWVIDLLDRAADAAQTVIPLVPPQPEGIPAQRMIKPKGGKKRDGKRERRNGS